MITTSQIVAQRFILATAVTDFIKLTGEIIAFHEGPIQKWVNQFSKTLAKSIQISKDLPIGWVWQDEFLDYFNTWDVKLSARLQSFDEQIEAVWLDTKFIDDNVEQVRRATTEPPHKGSIAHAIGNFEFYQKDGRDHIAYSVSTLKEWHAAFMTWSKKSSTSVQHERVKVLQRARKQQVV